LTGKGRGKCKKIDEYADEYGRNSLDELVGDKEEKNGRGSENGEGDDCKQSIGTPGGDRGSME
jgi:hypothetical protein